MNEEDVLTNRQLGFERENSGPRKGVQAAGPV